MEYIKLCEVISSAKIERCGASDYPVLSITKSDGVVLQSDKFKKRIASRDTEQYKLVKRGQLVQGIHIDEANFGIQSIVDIGIVSPAYKIWNVDFQKIVPKYLETVLRSPRSVRYYSSKFNGSVKRRERITDSDFLAMEIPFPSKEQQQYAVDVLEKVCSMTTLYQQQLQKLDELVKARFVEMFSSCQHIASMNELCSIITDGTHQPPKFQDNGIPFIFVSNLVNNTVTYNAEKFISEETYGELYKRTPIEIGDLLLSTVGSYGHVAVVVEDKKFLFQRHIAYLKPKHEIVNSFYLYAALLSPDGQRQIEEKVKGIAQKTLNLSEIKTILIPLPSIEEQKNFEVFIKQVDKSKVAVQKALDEAQLLFDSLMQTYFDE
ncbi:restriction endonuclease subunit S [Flintibacter faecis]|uniref:Restriction endonuclease subunit S n=1 Tax=Flintibacter faecis TaxID=2763047 RepID=A0A8J6IY25_9FIRM|nr:restriction endonuclease subunit S [Flintibacter faecis]MBC5717190.1 restriction endonuclease subunit S [Flintibacter faecis]